MDILLTKRKYLKYQEDYEKENPLVQKGVHVQHRVEIVGGHTIKSIIETPYYYDRPPFEKWLSIKLGFKNCIGKITIKV